MVDLIPKRCQEVYANWESHVESNQICSDNTSTLTTSELRRAGSLIQRKVLKKKECARILRKNALFRIKESEITFMDPTKNSSFLCFSCQNCTPLSRKSYIERVSKQNNSNLLNLFNLKSSIISKMFLHISQLHNYNKYDNTIATHVINNKKKPKNAIHPDTKDILKIKKLSKATGLFKMKQFVCLTLQQIKNSLNDILCSLMAWMLYKFLSFVLQAVVIHSQQIKMLEQANKTKLPLIFMPLHRSCLDHILINFLTLKNNIRTPFIFHDENVNVPFSECFVSDPESSLSKTQMDIIAVTNDSLHKSILHAHIMKCLCAAHSMEFFVEGKQTHTGKPCISINHIFSIIVDAYMNDTIDDALIVPLCINYERLIEGNFVLDQLGKPKKIKNFYSTINAFWTILTGNYGIAKIEICQPFSLSEIINFYLSQKNTLIVPENKQLKMITRKSSLYEKDIFLEKYQGVIDYIAHHIIYDCSKSLPIMSTNVLAFLLLNKFRDGCTIHSLIDAFDEIRQEFELAKREVGFCGKTIDIIHHAIQILGPRLIKKQQQIIVESGSTKSRKLKTIIVFKPVCILPTVLELSYYSNTMLLYYLMESILITAFDSLFNLQKNAQSSIADNEIIISENILVDQALTICNIFKHEFMFCKPCQDLKQIIHDTIDILLISGIIFKLEDDLLSEEVWSHKFSKDLDENSDEEYKMDKKHVQYKKSLTPEHKNKMELFHMLLRPLVDTYTISAFCLKKLVGRTLTEMDFIQGILNEIKINFDQGIVNYGESLSLDSIKNSLKIFQTNNVLESYLQENIKIYYLNEDYDNDIAINEVYETMAIFKWMKNDN